MTQELPDTAVPPDNQLPDQSATTSMDFLGASNITQALLFDKSHDQTSPAIRTAKTTLTYEELQHRINRFGNFLLEKGLTSGDRVIVQLGNRPSFLIAMFALQKINCLPVPLAPRRGESDVKYIVEDSEARVAVTCNPYDSVYRGIDQINHIVTTPFETDGHAAELASKSSPDDFALLMYSSGTTGNPKGTLKQHQELYAATAIVAKCWNLTETDTVGGNTPIAFAMGYLFLGLAPFLRSATVSLIREPDTETVIHRIATDEITIFVSVPTGYIQIMDRTNSNTTDFSSLRLCITGGDRLKEATYERWYNQFDRKLVNYYGSSELFSVILYQNKCNLKPCKNGSPPDEIVVKLMGDSEPNEDLAGELAVKAPMQVRYWKNPQLQKESVKDGFFLTGDIFARESDGEFMFKGRQDDLIMCSGHLISPSELEDALVNYPSVENATVIGVNHTTHGEVPKAFIQLAGTVDDPPSSEDLQSFVKKTVAPHKYPREIMVVPEIPKTEAGKIDRQALEMMESQEEQRNPTSVSADSSQSESDHQHSG